MIFKEKSIVVQDEFIASVNRQLLDKMEENIQKTLKANGINNVQVGFSADIFQNELKIEQISVDLSQIVIDEKISHINIKTSIRDIILRFVSIEEKKIVFYE